MQCYVRSHSSSIVQQQCDMIAAVRRTIRTTAVRGMIRQTTLYSCHDRNHTLLVCHVVSLGAAIIYSVLGVVVPGMRCCLLYSTYPSWYIPSYLRISAVYNSKLTFCNCLSLGRRWELGVFTGDDIYDCSSHHMMISYIRNYYCLGS